MLFYLPRFFWKKMEGGRMNFCAKNMKEPEEDEEKKAKAVTKLMDNYRKFKLKNNRYAMKFFLFECINLLNAVMQMFMTNKFMGDRFTDYGLKLWDYYHLRTKDINSVRLSHEYLSLVNVL